MPQTASEYSKLRWLMTIAGLVLYMVDIATDVGLALRYFRDSHFVWAGLTVTFVLAGLLGTQIFSYAWYRQDSADRVIIHEGKTSTCDMAGLTKLHLFGMAIFTRHYYMLMSGYHVVWTTPPSDEEEEKEELHLGLFGQAADLSMLKLFEVFLESAPQLLLQVYIVLGQEEGSVMQYISMTFSLFNIAWALVDYRRCLRRSLPVLREMPPGLPTVIYLLYKLFTITAHILSYGLLLTLSPYSTVGLALIWFLWTVWAHVLQTDFCEWRLLEWLYRAIIGVTLMFTFFNVKGQNTKVAMGLYYLFYSLIDIVAPILLVLLEPEIRTAKYFLPVSSVIYSGTVLGLVYLMVYYAFLHPRGNWREADELDGIEDQSDSQLRIRKFLWT